MKIYKISTENHGKYAYATGYHAFQDMEFLESVGEYRRKMMEESWRIFPREAGLHIEDPATCWADVMFCGNPPPFFFCSRKVVNSLESHNIPLRRSTLIPIGCIKSKKLREIPPPEYFVLEALPGIQVDYASSGYVVAPDGLPDPNAPRITPSPIPQYDPATWTGADLFCQSNSQHGPRYLDLLCTERIKEIALQDGWTNVAFQRLRVKGINPFTGRPE